jgi:hypothetical protein
MHKTASIHRLCHQLGRISALISENSELISLKRVSGRKARIEVDVKIRNSAETGT